MSRYYVAHIGQAPFGRLLAEFDPVHIAKQYKDDDDDDDDDDENNDDDDDDEEEEAVAKC